MSELGESYNPSEVPVNRKSLIEFTSIQKDVILQFLEEMRHYGQRATDDTEQMRRRYGDFVVNDTGGYSPKEAVDGLAVILGFLPGVNLGADMKEELKNSLIGGKQAISAYLSIERHPGKASLYNTWISATLDGMDRRGDNDRFSINLERVQDLKGLGLSLRFSASDLSFLDGTLSDSKHLEYPNQRARNAIGKIKFNQTGLLLQGEGTLANLQGMKINLSATIAELLRADNLAGDLNTTEKISIF